MDGLSAAASATAVIQITGSICSILRKYYQGVRDARQDIDALHKAVRTLALIVAEIRHMVECKTIPEPQDLLKDCEADLTVLKSEIGPPLEHKARYRYLRFLRWPLKKSEVEERVAIIERHKSSLSMFLDLESLYVITNHSALSIIYRRITLILVDKGPVLLINSTFSAISHRMSEILLRRRK